MMIILPIKKAWLEILHGWGGARSPDDILAPICV
jgi:hypothetical protein